MLQLLVTMLHIRHHILESQKRRNFRINRNLSILGNFSYAHKDVLISKYCGHYVMTAFDLSLTFSWKTKEASTLMCQLSLSTKSS